MEVGDGLGDGIKKIDSLCDGSAVNDFCGLRGHFDVGGHFCEMC